MPIPVLIDTDIGTDIDDLLALLTVLGSPEIDLVAITTTYGDTRLRARIAKQVCDWAGVDVPIGAGHGVPMSGREVWLAGHEEAVLDDHTSAAPFDPSSAAEVIADAVRDLGSSLTIVAIGPLTNIAEALIADPDLAEKVDKVLMMGGDFAAEPGIEHNILSDAEAAHRVMTSHLPVTAIGVDQTRTLRLMRDEALAIATGHSPLRRFLGREVERWLRFNDDDYLLLHDPLTVAILTHPDLFDLARGRISVEALGEHEGATSFVEDPAARNRIARSIDGELLRSVLTQRIARGLGD